MPTTINVRPISPGEGERLRAIRLTALADAPEAFGQTLEQARAMLDDEYDTWAESGAAEDDRLFLAAERQNQWVGMVGGHDQGERVELISMWVTPAVRSRGVGRALIGSFLDWAFTKAAEEAFLFVGESNKPAKALYSSMGFRPTGKVAPLAWNSRIRELEMARALANA